MLIAFDTSVLVAGALTHHEFHARAWPWLDAVERGAVDGCVCAHALAEVYSVLTKVPQGPSFAEANAITSRLSVVFRVGVISKARYLRAIDRCASRSLKSGAVFDALHLIEAERAGADVLLTFNPKDSTRLAGGDRPRILAPPDPPSLELPAESSRS